MKSTVLLMLLPALLVGACSSSNDRGKLLPMALDEFNAALVWKNYAMARYYLEPADASREISHLRKRGDKLRIVEVEPLETRLGPDGTSAAVLIRFSWYEEADLTVQKGVELQEWKRVGGQWRMVGRKASEDRSFSPSPFLTAESAEVPEPPPPQVPR
jgi:hypothetical protein